MFNKKNIIAETVYILLLSILSLVLISFYFPARYLETGYPDWMIHAFRAKFIAEHGFVSWTHFWSNGISLLRSYQFIPHYLTIWLAQLTGTDIPRAMVLMTIIQFVLLRINVYMVLRMLGIKPIAAMISSLLTLNIAQYWGTVSDYSLMFAVTLFPIMIYCWTRYLGGKLLYIFPYLCGISFYVHPLLGLYSFALGLFGVIFSERRILSYTHLLQLVIFLMASSLFWYPLVFPGSYQYSNEHFANIYFLHLVLSHYNYLGLSLYLFVILGMMVIRAFMPTARHHRWFTILTLFTVFFVLFIYLGTQLPLPRSIAQTQYTRGMALIGISALICFGVVTEMITNISSQLAKGVVMFFFCLAVIEGIWFTSVHSPTPVTVMSEPVSTYLSSPNSLPLTDGRILAPDIGRGSYFIPSYHRLPISYMGHLESNQIPPRLAPLMREHPYLTTVPQSNIDRISTYLKVSGTKYLFLEETSSFTRSLLDSSINPYKNLGLIETTDGMYRLFQTPGETHDAYLVDKHHTASLIHFPFDLQFSNVNDQTALDDYVQKLSKMLEKKENTPLAVEYPAQDLLQITLPQKRQSSTVFIKESYDAGWEAYLDGKKQTISPAGPNYMQVTLDRTLTSTTLILKHSWPLSWHISLYFIILIPIEILLYRTLIYFRTKQYATH